MANIKNKQYMHNTERLVNQISFKLESKQQTTDK